MLRSRYARLDTDPDRSGANCNFETPRVSRPLTGVGIAGEAREELPIVPDGVLAEAVAKRAKEEKIMRDNIYCVPSTEVINHAKLQDIPSQERQNIENGDPNVRTPVSPSAARSMPGTSVDNVNSTRIGFGVGTGAGTGPGPSLFTDEQQRSSAGVLRGGSVSARWMSRNTDEGIASRLGLEGCDFIRKSDERGNGFPTCTGKVGGHNPSYQQFSPGSWVSSGGRVGWQREAKALPHPRDACYGGGGGPLNLRVMKPQLENRSCYMHMPCSDACQGQRSSAKSSADRSTNADHSVVGSEESFASVMQQQQQAVPDGSYGSSLCDGKIGLQRSYSTRELKPSSEVCIEKWKSQNAFKSARQAGSCNENRHRVSFSLVETHNLEQQQQQELKQREKWKETNPHTRKVLSMKQAHPEMRYNYEQPGFVERDAEVSGKPYTIYGVRNVKESSRSSHSRPQKFVRAFSLREHQSSNYTKMSRSMSANGSGRNVLPVECVTCGQGIGVVVFGPSGDDTSFCQSCRSSTSRGWNCPGEGERPTMRKKKGIMEYCRKLLKIPKKLT